MPLFVFILLDVKKKATQRCLNFYYCGTHANVYSYNHFLHFPSILWMSEIPKPISIPKILSFQSTVQCYSTEKKSE